MVLKINNEIIEDFSSFEDLLTNYPDLAESSSIWKNSEIKTVYKHDRYDKHLSVMKQSAYILRFIDLENILS